MDSREAEIKAVAEDFAETRTRRSFSEGKWSVSDLNFAPEVTDGLRLPGSVTLTDLTLSRYAQTSGIALSVDDAKAVLRALDAMHLPILELSVWYSPDEEEELRQYVELGLDAELSVMIGYIKGMPYEDQIDLAARVGLDYVTITTGPSRSWDKAYRGKSIGDSTAEAIRTRAALVARAKDKGLKVRAAFQYPTYLKNIDYMLELFVAEAAAGADSLIVMDHGGLSPALTRHLITLTKEAAPHTPVGIHYHDSLGVAVACEIAAVEAGAEIVDVTINGVGSEGHADLAQLAISLEALYGVKTGADLSQVRSLYSLFAERSGFGVWSHKPVVGEKFYELSSDAVSRAFMIDYDPYISTTVLPEAVGSITPFEFGLQSGPIVLARRARALGLEVPEAAVPEIVDRIKAELIATKRPIGDKDLVRFVQEAKTA
jgi:isopropylmalate/homocitrate/citramalate synthase